MSHKAAYVGKTRRPKKTADELKLFTALDFERGIQEIKARMDAGFDCQNGQTTTCCGSGALSGNNRRPRSQTQARKPKHQK